MFQLRLTALTPSEVEPYGGKATALLEFDVSSTQPSPDAKTVGDVKNSSVVQSGSSVSVVLSPQPTDENSIVDSQTEQVADDKRCASPLKLALPELLVERKQYRTLYLVYSIQYNCSTVSQLF